MIGAALAIAVAVSLTVGIIGAVVPPATTLLLEAARAIEIPPEQAPGAHAVLVEFAHVAGIPRPRLFVAAGSHPTGAALQGKPFGIVAVSDAAFDVLTGMELRGLLAVLVAALAVGASRERIPRRERWYVADRVATLLTGPQMVTAALSALMRCESNVCASRAGPFGGFLWALTARLNMGVTTAFGEPTMAARVALLTAKPESETTHPSPKAPTGS